MVLKLNKYRKKPIVIEAMQYTGDYDSFCIIQDFVGSAFIPYAMNEDSRTVGIKTLEGNMTANVNDYIIKGVNGEFYPCKPDIFEKTYEKV